MSIDFYKLKVKEAETAIDGLAENPRPDGVKKLKGSEEDLYRIRVGDYRIIYEVYDIRLIVNVVAVAHRREVYE